MSLLHAVQRFFAPNSIVQQLYPPPQIPITFRPYEAPDRERVLQLHDVNAPGRFPENHRPVFKQFLDKQVSSFFVAETEGGMVAACFGVTGMEHHVHALCYGLVAPEFQGKGIGSTMILARLAFATRTAGLHLAVIFALPKSIGFYQRFGFEQAGVWTEDGKDYPLGALQYDYLTMDTIRRVLKKRGHLLDPTIAVHEEEETEDVNGSSQVQVRWDPPYG